MLSRVFPLLITFIFVIFLYYPVFGTYFSQDDFFHFKVSQTDGSFQKFINFFGFHSFEERDIAFYRPISREIPFNVYYSIFGLNHLPFRIFIFLIHFINIFLVYLFVQKVFQNKNLSFFVSFFFGITSANVATLYYLAGGIQTLLATLFTLCSLILFVKYLIKKQVIFYILSFLAFLLAISSHEQAAIIPFLTFGLIFIFKPAKTIRRSFIFLLPYLISVLLLFLLEFLKIGFSSGEKQYQMVFNLKTIFNSLFWYSGWALGVPETLIDFVYPGFKLNPTLLRYWSNYYQIIFPSLFLSITLILLALFYLILKKRSVFIDKRFLLFLFWFPLGLLPVLLLPLHKSTHYLVISLPAFWTLIGLVIFNFYNVFKQKFLKLSRIFLVVFISCLIILSATSAILGSTNYWAATRGRLAEKLITNLKSSYPTLPKGATVYFKNDPDYPYLTKEWGNSSKQASVILNGSDAIQLLYKDPTLKVYFEDLKTIDPSPGNIYPIIAKIY